MSSNIAKQFKSFISGIGAKHPVQYAGKWGKGFRAERELRGEEDGAWWRFCDGSKVWISDNGTRVELPD